MFLNGNFVALPAFQKHYGVHVEGSGWTIPTRWQSALFQAGQCGAFVGVFLAGPITNKFGYRWTTIFALMLMNATIFISFFVGRQPTPVPRRRLTRSVGQLVGAPCRRTSPRRCTVGLLHCQLPCLCFRDRASCPPWCLYGDSADELVYRIHHRGWCYLCLQ